MARLRFPAAAPTLTGFALTGLALAALTGFSAPARAEGLSSYGTPGLIDMPAATAAPDGTLAWTSSFLGGHTRNTLQFQITPRLSGVFRYSILRGYFDTPEADLYDRSFDLHYVFRTESPRFPALAVGLRDFGGTGVFGAEYLVATKRFLDNRLALSGGIGWGRLGSYHGFRNPLAVLGERFETRPGLTSLSETGRVSFNRFFRGEAALFGGLSYQLNDRLQLAVEYSSDAYRREVASMGFAHRSPVNFGLSWQASEALTLTAAVIGGAQLGLGFSYQLDPRAPRAPGGRERAVPPLLPRAEIAALGWPEKDTGASRSRLASALARDGLRLESYAEDGARARIVLANPGFRAAPQALGRAARAMANSLPAGIERFEITLTAQGMPTTQAAFRRADLHQLEHAWDGSWQSFARAQITDAPARLAPDPGVYPALDWSLLPYVRTALFDPDSPLRADVGLAASASYRLAPGLSVETLIRQKAFGTLDQSSRISNSIQPHVRSDAPLYDKLSGPQLVQLSADYLVRPGGDLYGRVSAGYFEQMFAGVSGEILWYPQGSRLALGAELNHLVQRDPAARLGLGDYRVTSGHASAYYDFGDSYRGQLDLGRYLAGDWGGTLTLAREFDNGFRVAAFFTLTGISFDDFGEGSFDKGISLTIPLDWLTGEPSRRGFAQTIRPIQRDGGARVAIAHRLYEEVRGTNAQTLSDQWGKFWR
ncbi:YjbH domain-containing protein [Rhodobacter capsulatus]|uniref:YjbH domain-containing protein n=1 Tax=Rhodobacter capsulatus TaxID=1061 RepID=UPI0040270028